MNTDGNNHVQLTFGQLDSSPECSPDGQWVVYLSETASSQTLWKVPITGGLPIQLTKQRCNGPGVSPDGRLVACWWGTAEDSIIAIINLYRGGEPIKLIDTHDRGAGYMRLKWTSDGLNVVYIATRSSLSIIWQKPVSGGTRKQLADFKDTVFGFDWSRNDSLLVSRGFLQRGIVLMQDVGR